MKQSSKNSKQRRDATKKDLYARRTFYPVKRYDGKGNLIGEISEDKLMKAEIGGHLKSKTKFNRFRKTCSNSASSNRSLDEMAKRCKNEETTISYKKVRE